MINKHPFEPTGDRHERLLQLVEIAKQLGFKHATAAYWPDDNMECPLDELDDLAGILTEGDTERLHIGIFLNESVLATVRVDPDDENDLIVDVEDWKEQKP